MKKEKDLEGQTGGAPEGLTPKKIFEQYIQELNRQRHEVGEAHRRHQERFPSRFGNTGSEDVYALSMQIMGAVNLAKELGLVGKDTDPHNFLK